MKNNGSDFSKLQLRQYDTFQRGIFAKENIKEGETVLYLPLSQMITMEMAAHSPLGKLMHEKGLIPKLKQSKTTYLATYLLQERNNKDSPYAEYFDTLPKSFGEFPVFFSEDEKAWLKGSPF